MAPGALPPTALPAPVLLGLLQKWLPPTDENMRICELSLLRLGCLVQNGLVDLVEFYWRFEGLARGEAVAGVPAGAGIGFLDPGPLLDTAGSQEGLARGEAVAGVPAGAGIGFLDPGPLLDTA